MAQFSPQEIFQEIDRQANTFGVDPAVAKAIFIAENSDDGVLQRKVIKGATTSNMGARGVMQTMPDTEEALKKTGFLPKEWQYNPADLRGQVQAGLAAMKEKLTRLRNPEDPLALAAFYNGGTYGRKTYEAGLLDQLPKETQHYLKKVQTALGGLKSMEPGTNTNRPTPQQIERNVASPSGGPGTSASSSSFARQGSTTSAFDPTLVASALSQGMQLIQQGGAIDTAIADVGSAVAARKQAEAAQVAAAQQAGAIAGQSVMADTAVATAAATRRAEILSRMNINPDIANNIAQVAADSIISETAQLEGLGSEIDNRMAVGFFDNPLQWLVNQTRLPGMVGQYNAGVESVNRKIAATKELQGLATTQINLSQAIDADLIAAQGKAKAAEVASKATQELTKIQAEQAGNAVRDAQLGLVMAGEKFKVAANMAELTAQVRRDNREMSEREAEKEAEKISVDRINKWLKMVGSELQYTPAQFKSLPGKTKQELFEISSTDRIAANMAQAFDAINRYGSTAKIASEGDAAAVSWIRNTTARAQQQTAEDLKLAEANAKITGKVLKREEYLAANLQKIQELYQAETRDMRTASPDNPMKIDYSMMLKDPGMKGNAVAGFLQQYGPASANPIMPVVDERLILNKFAEDISLGKVTSAQAAEQISQFYKTGARLQAERTKYPLFGLDKPANGYTVVIPKPGMFEKNVGSAAGVVDLTNPAAVESFLIKDVAVRARNATPAGPYRSFMDPLGLTKTGANQ